MGSHATCSGAWASGPEDIAPADYQWGYNRMMTIEGLFGAGDTIGGSAHKFSSGSYTEGRLAGKSAVKYVRDHAGDTPQLDETQVGRLKAEIYRPLENCRSAETRSSPRPCRPVTSCRCRACSGWKRSWMSTSAASAPTT